MILTQHLNTSSIYSDPGIYFLVLTRMVENDMQVPVATGVDEFDSVVRGHKLLVKCCKWYRKILTNMMNTL